MLLCSCIFTKNMVSYMLLALNQLVLVKFLQEELVRCRRAVQEVGNRFARDENVLKFPIKMIICHDELKANSRSISAEPIEPSHIGTAPISVAQSSSCRAIDPT